MHRHLIVDANDKRNGQPRPDDELSAAEKAYRFEKAPKREEQLWQRRARFAAQTEMLNLAAESLARKADRDANKK